MRIVQITDSHVTAPGTLWKGRVDMAAALERAVARVNALAPDLVVHTGDVVDGGGAAQYGAAAEILGGLAAPLRLIPGNHDDRARMRAAFPGQDWPGETLTFAETAEGLALIGLDTLAPGETAGRFDAPRAGALAAALPVEGPALLFAHHPPCPMGLPFMDRFVFEGGDHLARAIAGREVLRIATGHVHAAAERHWAGTLVSACPATGVQIPPAQPAGALAGFALEPAAIRLHDWDAELGLTVKTVPVDGFEAHPFEPDPDHPFNKASRAG